MLRRRAGAACFVLVLLLVLGTAAAADSLLSVRADFESAKITLPPLPSGARNLRLYRQLQSVTTQAQAVNISIDGQLDDWQNVLSVARHPMPPEDQSFFQDMWLYHDADYLYMRLRCADSFWDLTVNVLFDTDQNPATGLNTRGLQIGADYILEYSFFHKGVGRYNTSYLPADDPKAGWTMFWELGTNVWFATDQTAADTLELRIPLDVFGRDTAASRRFFGADILVKVNQDTFPTIGYGHKSPGFVQYGWHQVATAKYSKGDLPGGAAIQEDLLSGLTYQYWASQVDRSGNEAALGTPVSVFVPFSYARDFNVEVTSASSFHISWKLPEDRSVSAVRVLRSESHFPAHENDGAIIYEGLGTSIDDTNLISAKGYWWAIYSRSGSRWSRQYWDCQDHSMATHVRGPLPGITTSSDLLIYFANWDDFTVREAEKYDIIILHPGGGSALLTPDIVRDLRDGVDNVLGTDDDCLVIGYISIGEDYGMANASHPGFNDPRSAAQLGPFYDDGKGPVYFNWTTGEKVYENKGQPSFYVDMWAYRTDSLGRPYGTHGQDGAPDQNTEWGGLYVDSGNELWQLFLKNATYETFGVAGFDYILEFLGMDGVFLDTVGVSAPWSYWDPPSYLGDYYWIRDGHLNFLATLGTWYPDKLIIPNRPMHFVFPEFAGKRYDDFRTYVNGLLWESYSSDMAYWWRGGNGRAFEAAARAAQDNSDGRGFSTLILDYYSVDIEAEEGGEYQNAPFYSLPSDQQARAEAFGTSYIAPSRSLADIDHWVYLNHHPDEFNGLPDLHVHSIIPATKGSWNWNCTVGSSCRITIRITNRGRDMGPLTEPLVVVSQWNNVALDPEMISQSLARGAVYEFNRTISELPAEGTNVRVEIDTTNVLGEYTKTNNHDDMFLDQFLNITAGKPYKHNILPDLVVVNVTFDPPIPSVGVPFTSVIQYKNQGPGTATASRMFIWLGDDSGGSQVGNIETPFLVSGETKVVNFTWTISALGSYSISFICDAINKVPQTDRSNDQFSARLFAASTSDQLANWNNSNGVSGGTIPSNTPSMKLLRGAYFTSDGTHFIARIDFTRSVSPQSSPIDIFIDTDANASTGYELGLLGVDLRLQTGSPYRWTGRNATDWSWKKVTGADADVTMSIEANDRWSFAIPLALLGDRIFLRFMMANQVSSTESLPPDGGFYQWPMSCDDGYRNQGEEGFDCGGPCLPCGPVQIDGRDDEWDSLPSSAFSIDADDHAFHNATYIQDDNWLYLLMRTSDVIDTSRFRYQIFVGVRNDSASDAISVNYGVMNARFMLDSGKLYRYSGAKGSWSWRATSPAFEDARWAITETGRAMEMRIARKVVSATNGSRVFFTLSATEIAESDTAWMPGKGKCFDDHGHEFHVDLGSKDGLSGEDGILVKVFFGGVLGSAAVVVILVVIFKRKKIMRWFSTQSDKAGKTISHKIIPRSSSAASSAASTSSSTTTASADSNV